MPTNKFKKGDDVDFAYPAFYALGVAYPEHLREMFGVFACMDKLLTHGCLKHLNNLQSQTYLSVCDFVNTWVIDGCGDISRLVERVCQVVD